jgi:outer membrane protein assembly factor BamB
VASSPAIADGKLYIGSNDGYLYCLNATSGTLLWNYRIGTEAKSSPAIADGKLYIVSREGTVFCFGASSAQPVGPSFSPSSYELYTLIAVVVIVTIFACAYLYVRIRKRKST